MFKIGAIHWWDSCLYILRLGIQYDFKFHNFTKFGPWVLPPSNGIKSMARMTEYIYWCKNMVNPADGMCFSTLSFHQCTFEHEGLCFHCTFVSVETHWSLKTLHFVMI